jgi:hypothetical protein
MTKTATPPTDTMRREVSDADVAAAILKLVGEQPVHLRDVRNELAAAGVAAPDYIVANALVELINRGALTLTAQRELKVP